MFASGRLTGACRVSFVGDDDVDGGAAAPPVSSALDVGTGGPLPSSPATNRASPSTSGDHLGGAILVSCQAAPEVTGSAYQFELRSLSFSLDKSGNASCSPASS